MGKIIKNGIEYGGGGSGTGGHTIVDTDGNPVADEPKLQFTGLDVQDNSTDSETEVAAFGLNTDSLDDIMSAGVAGNQVAGNGLVYSTTEQVVGKWIDGKPIYQKTVTSDTVTYGQTWSSLATVSNIDTVVWYGGILHEGGTGKGWYNIPTYRPGQQAGIGINIDSAGNISYMNNWVSQVSGAKIWATIQYTKTTD